MVHGGDAGHIQYAALDQITKDNVSSLEVAWRWTSVDVALRERHDELQEARTRIFRHEVTPLKIGDSLYASTSLGQFAAIDPASGETLWSYDPEVWRAGRPTNLGFMSKGLAYWTDGTLERLFYAGGAEVTLVSVDPTTGRPDERFGDGGKVDLTEGLGPHVARTTYTVTSTPTVVGDVVIVGSSIRDTPPTREVPPGHVRAYDVRTGELKWTFHTIPGESDFGNQSWLNDSWRDAGAVNVWSLMTADPELGYVYLPVGTEAHNWYGGHRPGDNLFACSLVALDARTGERVWHYQFVHHPIWDWDPPAAPTLIDIDVDGRAIKAVAQVTKQGFLFVLDRVTGEPVWPIEERPVPQSFTPAAMKRHPWKSSGSFAMLARTSTTSSWGTWTGPSFTAAFSRRSPRRAASSSGTSLGRSSHATGSTRMSRCPATPSEWTTSPGSAPRAMAGRS